MRMAEILATIALLALVSRPALAEQRWLACKFNDTAGKAQNFFMMFDTVSSTIVGAGDHCIRRRRGRSDGRGRPIRKVLRE